MRIHKTGPSSTLARIGITVALVAAATGGLATSSQAVAQQAVTLSALTGPNTGGNTVTLALPTTAASKFSNGSIGVVFQNTTAALSAAASCDTNPIQLDTSDKITAPAANVRFLSNVKASVKVPALSGGTTGYWLLCVYNAATATPIPATATVIGRANYLVQLAPTLSSVTPASGPAFGGQTVTVLGSNFPTTIAAATPLTATLGGVAMTGVTAVDATHFTAITPAHATGTAALSATTAGGTVNLASAYTFVDGITVTPNTIPTNSTVDVDVMGTGFAALTFSASDTAGLNTLTGVLGTNSAGPHVYLVSGVYDATAFAVGSVNKTNGQVGECINPVVISDTELICTVDTGHSVTSTGGAYTWNTADQAAGTYTVTVVNSGNNVSPTYQTVVSSGATFTVANF